MSSAPDLSESVGSPLRFSFLEFHLFLFNTHFFILVFFLPYKSNYLLTVELYHTEGQFNCSAKERRHLCVLRMDSLS